MTRPLHSLAPTYHPTSAGISPLGLDPPGLTVQGSTYRGVRYLIDLGSTTAELSV